MNVRSERMLVSARFSATAQLGRVCKKSVRRRFRGVRGGSLSKKSKLNQPGIGVRKVRGRFQGSWPHFWGSRRPVLRPWWRRLPVCTRAAGYRPVSPPWRRSIDAAVFAHCAAHSDVAVWQLQRSIPIVRAWRESRGSVSALDCRTVRQRRLTSSFRLDSPARNLPTLSPAYAGAGSPPPPCSPVTGSQPHPLSPSPR